MKYFLYKGNKILFAFFIISMFVSCATYQTKYYNKNEDLNISESDVENSIYLIGDAGNADLNESTSALKALKEQLQNNSTKNDLVIFLGDNIYEKGLPSKDHKDRDLAEHRMNIQIDAVKDFKGKVLFIPGNHDWYSDGPIGLKRQEKYIENALKDKNAFLPKKGCPIEEIDVSEHIVILVIDSQWYLENWDDHSNMNENCDIKTRTEFFLEIEGVLKKNSEKTVIIAMHHPTYTNGTHGGKFNFNNHLFPFKKGVPLPILGSFIAQLRTVGGVSPQDRSNNRYNKLMKRITTMVKGSEKVIFVSGHDHNLQYIENDGIKQIISGSGSKLSPTALGHDGLFSSGKHGFAVLNINKNGSSQVSFYSGQNNELLFNKILYASEEEYVTSNLNTNFEQTTKVSVYKNITIDRSKNYKWLWGDHYRYVYGTDIKVPVATLDTLNGGMKIIRTGGGHQTRSLRLNSKDGRTYAMRAIKKSAVQFLQTVAFKDVYIEDDLKNTFTEDLILDFYTSSHPFATFAVSELSESIGLYHTNPKMYYIPKHPYMGKYNRDYGDELYIIEERPDDTFLDVESFGKPDAIESTNDVIDNIRKDEKYEVDEKAFVKARLFDMLIGDWDRHFDQWRWSRFNVSDDKVVYRPIPRDRDQAFSNYDGALFDVLKVLIPASRQFQTYDEELKNVDWINLAGIKIDRTFLQQSTKWEWIEQAKYIQENLTDEEIDNAFAKLPMEVQDENIERIKSNLKKRRDALEEIAIKYYDYISKLVIITGTDKNDYIDRR